MGVEFAATGRTQVEGVSERRADKNIGPKIEQK
jgi:hypothetical protein